jgi:hypothetical protein
MRRLLSRHGATNSERTRVPFPPLPVAMSSSSSLSAAATAAIASSLAALLTILSLQHNLRRDISKILDLAAVVRLALDCSVMWDPCVDVGPPDAIPTNHGLVGLEMANRDKHPRAVLVDVVDKVVNQHPMVLLQQHAVWLLRWLTRLPDGIMPVARRS